MEKRIPKPNILNISKKAGLSIWKTKRTIRLIKRAMQPFSKSINVLENSTLRYFQVERRGIGILNTEYGKFWEYNFAIDDQWQKYSVIVKAGIDTNTLIPVFKDNKRLVLRTDSGCETGQLFKDLTCECRDQLHLAMKTITEQGEGMIISIPSQDGRGMGLTFKLATLWLQDYLKVNTVESAALLAPGGVIDVRTYSGVICILKFFGILETCQISLATNNPKKTKIFYENGYTISECTSVLIKPTNHTKIHLLAKQKHLGHVLNISEKGDTA
jgi:3,4-dihydroxy 2-butanone 4-phosphate synthase/GTP cyclohydrolase II